jgi:hypothetical protein
MTNSYGFIGVSIIETASQSTPSMGLAFAVGADHGTWVDAHISAQANPCALLTIDEIKSLADKSSVADGVPQSLPDVRHVVCDYMWGTGTRRVKLAVVVTDPSLMFPGVSPDQVKQRILESVRAGTHDAVIPEVGEAAVFKPDSVVYASATAIVKGHPAAASTDSTRAREGSPHRAAEGGRVAGITGPVQRQPPR